MSTSELDRALDHVDDGPITVDITTTGRRSGEPRRIEIWIVKLGGRVFIGGTPGPRSWLANLRADPQMLLHLRTSDSNTHDIAVTATEVTDAEVREEFWTSAATEWYRGQVPVERLISESPLVELRAGRATST